MVSTQSSGARPDLVRGLLEGNRRSAGRLMSLLEDDASSAEQIMRHVYQHTGNAYVVGITGPPGAGKSTIVDELIRVLREENHRVGVVAVDPNSPFTGGALLGDRIRMMRHAGDPGVFIRSMGTRGHLGGVALATFNTILLLDAMGMDIILAETVGVGQSELEIVGAADTTVVVLPPGLGDGVQAIKAGIMEIADIFVVNKADHPQVQRTISDIRELLAMDASAGTWIAPIVKTIAIGNQGLEDLWMRIQQHRQYLESTGELTARRRKRVLREIEEIAERRLREEVLRPRLASMDMAGLVDEAAERRLDPYEIADRIVPRTVKGGR